MRRHAFPRAISARAVRVSFGRSRTRVRVAEAHPIASRSLSDLKSKTFEFRNELPVPRDTIPAAAEQTVETSAVADLTDRMSPDGSLDWQVPAGNWTIIRFGFACTGRMNHPASKHG